MEPVMSVFLEQFASTLSQKESSIITDVREFAGWQIGRQDSEFDPRNTNNADVLTYLLHLRINGTNTKELDQKRDALKRFYEWAKQQDLLVESPAEWFNFKRPVLGPEHIRKRTIQSDSSARERELTQLEALKYLAESLNRAADINTALEATLKVLIKITGSNAAWISLMADAFDKPPEGAHKAPHGFVLGASANLPPGLEQDNFHYLRQPPECQCQKLLRTGRLTHAVNIVECSRLRDAARANGDTRDLLYHATIPIYCEDKPTGLINIASKEWEFFSASDLKLMTIGSEQVGCALSRAQLFDRSQIQRKIMERELQMARVVQASLIPKNLPDIPNFSIAAEWRSLTEVAGDFYDIFPLPDDRYGIVVADVSGKGAPAAMYMATARTLIRSEAAQSLSPSLVIDRVNKILVKQSMQEMFVTAFYGVLDPSAKTLTFVNAGHEWPFLRRSTTETERLTSNGPLLGVFEFLELTDQTVTFNPGDALIVYTDGITDALNPDGNNYDERRLENIIKEAPHPATAEELKDDILADVEKFLSGTPHMDDITLLILSA
jgi:hypothetical protein